MARDCAIPENFQGVEAYPGDRRGTGWYKDRPREIASDDAELQKMAEHMMEDACTPGNPRDLTVEAAREILRDCVYDANQRKTGAPGGAFAEPHGNGSGPQTRAMKQTQAAGGG